ncbi:hypothetical protein A9Q79_09750 [Methylophaga sp. 42_25_T18]|nr:hypothetical protein A9Q79_09750 [Methylophaga sp. 42_25_T18]OUR89960.1 hypothetical protein A9Q92_00155 [Methylophaga sp. 42_8_T64]
MKRLLLVLILSLVITPQLFAQTQIGKAVFARGITTAETGGGDVRVLGAEAAIFEGDMLTTGEKSFVVIEFDDGTRMSLRPNTIFHLEKFKQAENQAEVRLHSGGLRASTGSISKLNPEGFKLHARNTTTIVRDADFDVRLCQEECEQEAENYQVQQKPSAFVVGRVAEIKGTLTITSNTQYSRLAVKGAPLYQGDTLLSGKDAYAVLAFRDKGRITIQAETTFKIDTLQFEQTSGGQDKALFDLIQGGLRALTGLIGEENKEAYQVNTPVATIGIRGTGFDLVCVGNCVAPGSKEISDTAILAMGDGLFASVWEGAISIKTDVGEVVLTKGSVVIVPDKGSKPKALPETPPFIDDNPAPRPDKVLINHENLFSSYPIKTYRFGLFFAVYKGHLTTTETDKKYLDLGIEEASRYDVDKDGNLLRLDRIPPLLRNDPYFKSIDESFWENYDFLDENFDDYFECTIL